MHVAERRSAAGEIFLRKISLVVAQHGRPQAENRLTPQERRIAERGADRVRRIAVRLCEKIQGCDGFFGHVFSLRRIESIKMFCGYRIRQSTRSGISKSPLDVRNIDAKSLGVLRIPGRRTQIGNVPAPKRIERPHGQLAEIFRRH